MDETMSNPPVPTDLEDGNVSTKLYKHDCHYCGNGERWAGFADRRLEYEALLESCADDPIVERLVIDNGIWCTEEFTIQNADMKGIVQDALENYQDFEPEEENWTFKQPYKPLVHRWERLQALCDVSTHAPEVKHAASLLLSFLRPILGPSVDALARTKRTGKVVFEDIWQIFSPGELVTTTLYDVEAVCRVTKYERLVSGFGKPYWKIDLEYLDWNGERCGYTGTSVNIGEFSGVKLVTSLSATPLVFNRSADEVRQRLVERGRRFEALRGYHFRTCNGTQLLLPGSSDERMISGRIIIDAYAYYYSINKPKPSLRGLEVDKETPDSTDDDSETIEARGENETQADEIDDWGQDGEYVEPPQRQRSDSRSSCSSTSSDGAEMKIKKVASSTERREILDTLTDEQCLLATPWVIGLDLKTKDWARFRVDDISPVVWNDDAFEHLILPGNEKELSWAFVENKALADNTFDDFIEDKGRGIIILMFGPPGVGKTFTAEAVAERARVPLYSVSAATLGINPAHVEESLQRALDLCKLWNAMLLLDEADVFIGARSDGDLTRNELVAVFLTKLEYYQGICFMTTNRVSNLDHAIQSRVDLFLRYVDLTVPARRRVWQNFMAKTGRDKFSLTEADLDELAKFNLNGREIKNLVKTANLLSLKDTGKKIDRAKLEMLANNRLQALEILAKP